MGERIKKRKPEALQTPFFTSAAPGSASSLPLTITSRTTLRGARILLPSAASPSPSTQGQNGRDFWASQPDAGCHPPPRRVSSSPRLQDQGSLEENGSGAPKRGGRRRKHRGAGAASRDAGWVLRAAAKPRQPALPPRRGEVTAASPPARREEAEPAN